MGECRMLLTERINVFHHRADNLVDGLFAHISTGYQGCNRTHGHDIFGDSRIRALRNGDKGIVWGVSDQLFLDRRVERDDASPTIIKELRCKCEV